MKKIQIFSFLLASIIFLGACDKISISERDSPVTGAKLKFIAASPNAPQMNFFLNNAKVSAVNSSTTNVEQGFGFGGNFPSLEYTTVTPGSGTLSIAVPPASTLDPNAVLFTGPVSFEDNKFYTIAAVDAYDVANKKVNTIVINDVLPAQDTSKAFVRFINLIPNSPAVTIVTTANNNPVVSNVAYKSSTDFVVAPNPGISTGLTIKDAATGVNLSGNFSFTFNKGRVYTIFTRGLIGTTTGANIPGITLYVNR